MTAATISPIQERAVQLLLSGSTVAATARELGIDRSTIYTWRKNHPAFTAACHHARKIQTETLTDGLQDLASTALDTLREILVAKDVAPAVRLRAAQSVLNAVGFQGRPQREYPQETAPPTPPQRTANINHAGIEALIGPPVPRIPHNSTQFDTFSVVEQPDGLETMEYQFAPTPTQPFRRDFPKVGRNEPCPCGSGQKFKRCCGNTGNTTLAATYAAPDNR